MFHFLHLYSFFLYILFYPKLSSLFFSFTYSYPLTMKLEVSKTSQTARSWRSVKFTSKKVLWTPWRRREERKYRSTRSYFRYYIQVCDELCAAAALPLGKQPPLPPQYSLGESQGRSGCFWRRDSFLSLPGVEQWFVFRPTCSDHYTEWAIRNEPKVKSVYRVSCFFNPDVLSCRWIPGNH